MNQWIGFALIFAVWLVLTRWVLPKLGVPT